MGQNSSQLPSEVDETPESLVPKTHVQSTANSAKKRRKKKKKKQAQLSDEASPFPVHEANVQPTTDTPKEKKKKSHSSLDNGLSSPAADNDHVESFAPLTQSSPPREEIPKADIPVDTEARKKDKKKKKKKKSHASLDKGLPSLPTTDGHVEPFAHLRSSSPSRGEVPEAYIPANLDTKKKDKKKKKKSRESPDKGLSSPPTANGHVEFSAHPTQSSTLREEVSPVTSKRKRESEPEHKKKRRRHSTAESERATKPERAKKKKKRHSTEEGLSTKSELNVEKNEGHTSVENLTEPKPKKKKRRHTTADLEVPEETQPPQESEPKKKKKSKKRHVTSEDNVAEELHPRPSTHDAFSAPVEVDVAPAPTPEPSQSKESHKQKDRVSASSGPAPVLDKVPSTPPAAITEPSNLAVDDKKAPRKARGPRWKDNLRIGHFTADEVQKVEEFKLNFCTTHGIPGPRFDEMVQHSERSNDKTEFPCANSITTKSEFWSDIYQLLSDRDRRSVYRFMRRHFQDSMQKPHDWTPAQDRELIELHAEHGPKWVHIAKMLGRSDDDVTQRWKNRLEHRDSMNRGPWTEPETCALLAALQENWDRLRTMNPQAAGKDIYEMDETTIGWGAVSDMMGNVRSRQQVADKWRKIRRKIDPLRANGQPDAVYDPVQGVKDSKRWEKRAPWLFKSSEYVTDNGSDDEDPRIDTAPASAGTANRGFVTEQQIMAHASAQRIKKGTEAKSSSGPQSDSAKSEADSAESEAGS